MHNTKSQVCPPLYISVLYTQHYIHKETQSLLLVYLRHKCMQGEASWNGIGLKFRIFHNAWLQHVTYLQQVQFSNEIRFFPSLFSFPSQCDHLYPFFFPLEDDLQLVIIIYTGQHFCEHCKGHNIIIIPSQFSAQTLATLEAESHPFYLISIHQSAVINVWTHLHACMLHTTE